MAKQTVNIGAAANDGTGDALRTAFDKINDNFNELYAVTGAGTGQNIAISGNSVISENSNGNIILDPNGTGRVVLATSAELRFTTHTDNAVLYVDSDGDVQLSSALTFNGSTLSTTGSISVNSRLKFENNVISTQTTNDDIDIDPAGTGLVNFNIATQTTVGAAGIANSLPATPEGYAQFKINGTAYVIPFYLVS